MPATHVEKRRRRAKAQNIVVPSSPLGNFAMLPPELRFMIWQHFIPSDPNQSQELIVIKAFDKPGEGDDLAIMRTSHQMNDEICGELYDRKVLRINIDTDRDPWWVPRGLTGPTVNNYFRILKHTNLAWFNQIRIELHAPTVEDPGQLLLMRRILISLVKKLSDAAALPDVHIEFLGSWYTDNGTMQTSIPWDPTHFTTKHLQDMIVALRTFYSLHKVQKVSISLPASPPKSKIHVVEYEADQRDLHSCAEHVKTVMELQGAFFDRSIQTACHEDLDITRKEVIQTLYHDICLDSLGGYTAAHLRLSRFADWSIYVRMFLKAVDRSNLQVIDRLILHAAIRHRNNRMQLYHPKTGDWRDVLVTPENQEKTWLKRYSDCGMPPWTRSRIVPHWWPVPETALLMSELCWCTNGSSARSQAINEELANFAQPIVPYNIRTSGNGAVHHTQCAVAA